mmetsp:Transcript_28334/g.35034  ORF Transcript_28334/g.35034 Transcript_28334/m.35034 type:complete len:268 (+) Transcript_28334:107-910(+)
MIIGFLYLVLVALGPILYLINGLIDVAWSLSVRARNRAKTSSGDASYMTSIFDSMNVASIPSGVCNMDTTGTASDVSTENSPLYDDSLKLLAQKPRIITKKQRNFKDVLIVRLFKARKYVAHRRDLYAAVIFAIAAFLAVVDWYNDLNNLSFFLRIPYGGLSVHLYLASSLIAITGEREKPRKYLCWGFNDSVWLEDMGNLFFLLGSLIDIILWDFHFDDDVPIWAFISAITWFTDALLYIRSDIVQCQSNTAQLSNEDIDNDNVIA